MADPANRTDKPGGGKIYTHPVTGEVFDSVTTVLEKWDKDGLKQWAANLAGDLALELLPQLTASMIEPVCQNTYNRCYQKHGRENTCERCPCGVCTNCLMRRVKNRHHAESSRRAQEGTECHEAINFWILNGGSQISLRPEVQPYFNSFLRFVDDYGLEPNRGDQQGSWDATEITVINREHQYAGTSDGVIDLLPSTDLAREKLAILGRPDGARIRLDYKTREKTLDEESSGKERLFSDVALQDKAYDACPTAMMPDGTEYPNPPSDACAILQLRPDEYTFRLVVADGATFDAFVGILTAYRWLTGPGKSAFAEDPLMLRRGLAREQAVVSALMGEFDADLLETTVVEAPVLQTPDPVPVETPSVVVDDDPWADTGDAAYTPPSGEGDPWAEDRPRRDPNSPAEQAAKAEVMGQTPPRVGQPDTTAKKATRKPAERKIQGTTAAERAANRDTLKASRAKDPRMSSDPFASAATTRDPFALVDNPAQKAVDGGGPGILQAIKDFNPGAAQTQHLADEIPF